MNNKYNMELNMTKIFSNIFPQHSSKALINSIDQRLNVLNTRYESSLEGSQENHIEANYLYDRMEKESNKEKLFLLGVMIVGAGIQIALKAIK